MHKLSGRDYTVPRGWRLFGAFSLVLTVMTALIYLGTAHRTACNVRDVPLVAIVAFNAGVVFVMAWLLVPRLGELLEGFPQTGASVQARVDALIFGPGSVVLGVFWGAMISGGLYYFDPWARDVLDFDDLVALLGMSAEAQTDAEATEGCTPPIETMNRLLALFVFSGNLIIGAAIAVILRVWWLVLTHLEDLDLRILNLSRPPLPPLLRANSLIVTATALVASLSILALVLSGYEISATIGLFSMGTVLLVALAYAVPMLPLANRLMVLKSQELDAVEQRIEARLRAVSGKPQRTEIDVETLPSLDDLLEARKTIAAIRTLPPGGQVSVSAAGIVTFLSFLPTLIDYMVN